jgi:dipeptidyl-peptidase-4
MTVFARTGDFLTSLTNGDFKPKTVKEVYHFNDGLRYAMLDSVGQTITAYMYASGKEEIIFDINTIDKCPVKSIAGFEFDASEQKILVYTTPTPIYRRTFTAQYYIYNIPRNTLEPLSENGAQQMAKFSPNGRIVAFARNNNLFLKKLDFGTEIAITKDGEKNRIINGTPDWVYEEEFVQTRYFDFSPDSKLVAYIKFDESEVSDFSFQLINDACPALYTYKYAKAGTNNSKVSIHVYDVDNRTTKQIAGDAEDVYFPVMKFTARNDALAVVKLNRNQTEMNLLSIDPRSGVTTRLFSEKGTVYYDYQNVSNIHFNSDNSFVTLSERDGWRHLYLFDPLGRVKTQITKGEWDVTDFYGYDEKSKTACFQAAMQSPLERHVFRADGKGKPVCLDTRSGTHQAMFAKGFGYAIHTFNNTNTPNITAIVNGNGKVLRTISANAELKSRVEALRLPKKEFFQLTTADGIILNAWMVKPAAMEAQRKYPLLMIQYSGPNSQEVTDRWRIDWEYHLAELGYVVACVDPRGTGARGQAFRTCTYRNLGLPETTDLVASARYFAALPYIDATRIGIWGWSYGGFMTLMCMTHGEGIFKAGIAVAPVTDWTLYNTAYTERFMSRPQENINGYDYANLLEKADALQGNLLIVHGTADDNVHIQNTWLYAEKLVEAGKQFEMQLYTNKNHSILGASTRRHLFTRFIDFIQNNL